MFYNTVVEVKCIILAYQPIIPMDNQLLLLISVYKNEKALLQQLIDDCLDEMDYLGAHYYMQAMYMLNRKIQTLHNIDDPHYDKKQWIKRSVEYSEKRVRGEKSDLMRSFYESEIRNGKEQLEKLNRVTPRNVLNNNTLLFNTIEKLMDKKAKSVKLILKKSDNLLLAFTYSKQSLKVTLPYVKQLIKNWVLNDESIIFLKNLGFCQNESEAKLVLTITGHRAFIISELGVILSKIVFEIFYFPEFNNESYIQFTEK